MNIDQFQSISNSIKDPFSNDCVTNIVIEITKFRCIATVYFKNGPTSGHHELSASDYIEMNKLLAEFIGTLKES